MHADYVPLSALEVTNQCVVLCDLAAWTGPDFAAWLCIRGSQDDVGAELAAAVSSRRTARIDDFGGVSKTFLCDGESYLPSPPRTNPGAALFSFTPKNRILLEGQDMARVGRAAGYDLLILTVQKHAKFGKVWVFAGMLRHLGQDRLVYYEDTNTVVDELKSSPEGQRVHVVHVVAPGFEEHKSALADRVVTQTQYQGEVLQGR